MVARVFYIASLLELGDISRANLEIDRFEKDAELLKQPQSLWYSRLHRGMQALMVGNFAAAEHFVEQLLLIGKKVDDKNAIHSYFAHLLLIRWKEGRLGELIPELTKLVEYFPQFTAWRLGLTWVCMEAGEIERASQMFYELHERRFASIPPRHEWRAGIGILAEVCARLECKEAALDLYNLLSPFSQEWAIAGIGVAYWGTTARFLGILASVMEEWETAKRHFEFAIHAENATGARPWLAQTQYDYACMLFSRGLIADREQAHDLLRLSLATAQALELKTLISKIQKFETIS